MLKFIKEAREAGLKLSKDLRAAHKEGVAKLRCAKKAVDLAAS